MHGTPRPVVAVIGTCDTKLEALLFIKHTIVESGTCDAILIDVGTYEPPSTDEIDISRSQVLDRLPSYSGNSTDPPNRNDSGVQMAQALARTLAHLRSTQAIAAVIGAGGSGNTCICTEAFHDAPLPLGFPKMMVSTMASGNVSSYVRETDLTMMHSVVDVGAKLNGILKRVLQNAARAVNAMAAEMHHSIDSQIDNKPAVAVTMFGVTTPCVSYVEERLGGLGYDVVVFHATGAGGMAMERLISEGRFVGVMDLTTTELADELVGGVLSAGPHRLEAAARSGIPQVVSVGALDMVNFGPRDSVPPQFKDRELVSHNASVTLMRTTEQECAELGRILAEKVNAGDAQKCRVVLPLRGVSLLGVEGGPFFQPKADVALFEEIRRRVQCGIVEMDSSINDEQFADAAVDAFLQMVTSSPRAM